MKFQLDNILNPEPWPVYNAPFDYVNAENVFIPAFYQLLLKTYVLYVNEINLRLAEVKPAVGYDLTNTHIFRINYESPKPFHIFLSEDWHLKLKSYFNFPFTKDINVAIHYHDKGSYSGGIHNDLNPGWFIDTSTDEINIADSRKCDYHTGKLRVPGINAKKTIRSLAMIYYLNNPAASLMVGGGTGLYRSPTQSVDKPSIIIPPVNNSILIFPCTPYSYHSFLSNKSHQRCSIIMWLHSPVDYIATKYGEHKIVNWV